MNIFERNLETPDEIYDTVVEVIENSKNHEGMPFKFPVLKLFQYAKEGYEREKATNEIKKRYENGSNWRKTAEVIHINDEYAIVHYHADVFKDGHMDWYEPMVNKKESSNIFPSFDEAMIGLLANKYHEEYAARYIARMLMPEVCVDQTKEDK